MKISQLGHVVLRVTDLARAERFYNGLLGLPVIGRYDKNGFEMTFFTLGNHHDFAIMKVSGEGGPAPGTSAGLDHVAFKIGDDLDQLREARDHLAAAGVATSPVDHFVTKSIYFADPDGNGVELYVDASDEWKRDPTTIAFAEPMEL